MALVKVRAWQAMAAAAAALVAGSVTPTWAGTATEQGHTTPQEYETECSTPRIDTGARTCHYTFRYTGTIETFVLPPTTEPVRITAVGAPGSGAPGLQSRGATVTASFPSWGGMPIFITVGGDGNFDGYNGGGLGGGGGATDIRVGGPELEHRVMVAGGGGGWGQQLIVDESGVPGLVKIKGGDAGQPGLGSGGQPGTLTDGGTGGGTHYAPGRPGSFGRGGGGAEGYGGGGGGYYGGGGAGGCVGTNAEGTALCLDSQPGSGGGGSSLLPAGGSFLPTDDPAPRVTITVTQYGWWKA
ncbi:MAG TPA: glycine-rich protein [Acidimicrobiia bacterium]|nr:glycine-rich protein [Acidimicrobiia bacterium]